mgnify:CR=1 FL=1
MVVEPIVPKLSTKFWFSTNEKEKSTENRETIEHKIENTRVPVRAVLGRTSIMVNDFLDLQTGDVIPLDSNINGNLEILVGDLLKFYGTPGVKRNRIAVKVNEIVKGEEEE